MSVDMNKDVIVYEKKAFYFSIIVFCVILTMTIFLIASIFLHPVNAATFSVYELGSSHIIWNTDNQTQVSIDGVLTNVSGYLYSQNELESGTTHFISMPDGNDTLAVKTLSSNMDLLWFWIFIGILYAFIIIAFLFPITWFVALIYGIWMMISYLPTLSTDIINITGYGSFFAYLLVAVGMVVSGLSGVLGYSRRRS